MAMVIRIIICSLFLSSLCFFAQAEDQKANKKQVTEGKNEESLAEQNGQLSVPSKKALPIPKKAYADRNLDGNVDRIEHYDNRGNVTRIETDTNYDGKFDEWVHYKNGKVIKAEKDTNGDGKPDAWMEY